MEANSARTPPIVGVPFTRAKKANEEEEQRKREASGLKGEKRNRARKKGKKGSTETGKEQACAGENRRVAELTREILGSAQHRFESAVEGADTCEAGQSRQGGGEGMAFWRGEGRADTAKAQRVRMSSFEQVSCLYANRPRHALPPPTSKLHIEPHAHTILSSLQANADAAPPPSPLFFSSIHPSHAHTHKPRLARCFLRVLGRGVGGLMGPTTRSDPMRYTRREQNNSKRTTAHVPCFEWADVCGGCPCLFLFLPLFFSCLLPELLRARVYSHRRGSLDSSHATRRPPRPLLPLDLLDVKFGQVAGEKGGMEVRRLGASGGTRHGRPLSGA